MRTRSWKWIEAGWKGLLVSATVGVGWLALREARDLVRPVDPSARFDSAIFFGIWGIVLWLLWTRARWVLGLVWKGLHAKLDLIVFSMGQAMARRTSTSTSEAVQVLHYGAVHIHPKHLVYWICVRSDAEKAHLEADPDLRRDLHQLLSIYGYPRRGRDHVMIAFESEESVDRVSGGDWRRHVQ